MASGPKPAIAGVGACPASEMEGESGRAGVASLLEAIKASQDVDERIKLINLLGELDTPEKHDLTFIAESLLYLCHSTSGFSLTPAWAFWEDSSCSNMSQCMLNKALLNAGMKYVEKDSPDCLRNFLILATKASKWCREHIEVEEFHDVRHLALFYGLLTGSLSFSSAIFSVLTRSSLFEEKVILLLMEDFVREQLKLIKASIYEIKKIHSVASEITKAAQVVLDSAIKFCRAYSELIKQDTHKMIWEDDKSSGNCGKADNLSHFVKVGICILENLCSLGILAASGGGNLVTILNISWKGVVSLLQLGNGILSENVNIGDIILTLISLATKSLRCAADAWSSTAEKVVDIIDAKRAFAPIKFYLINSVRISSQYASQTLRVYKEISSFVLMISTFGIFLSMETHLKAAGKASAEFLEPTSFLLLLNLLNSAEVKYESKIQILDWLFTDNRKSSSTLGEKIGSMTVQETPLQEIFSVEGDAVPRTMTFQLGRVVLFLNLIKSSSYLREDVVLVISRKLGYLLDILITENVYSAILVLHVPTLHGTGPMAELVCSPIFPSVLHALKILLIVSSTSEAWREIECFLLENFIHPHFLCWEIIMELWCFLFRHADTETVTSCVNGICSVFKNIAVSEPSLLPTSGLRKVSRSICTILKSGAQSLVDQIYMSLFIDNRSHLSLVMLTALLMEGFPLDLLSDNLKKVAIQSILTSLGSLMENEEKKVAVGNLSESCSPGLPVYAVSSMLHSLQTTSADLDLNSISRVPKFSINVIQSYQSSTDTLEKDLCCKLLSQTLEIMSVTMHLYASKEISKIILQLQPLFVSGLTASDTCMFQCKPALASFMANLYHLEIVEGEGCAMSSAIWELYHLLLRDRHWALVHLALAAFGYFAARTSCRQLWRFMPSDAALSFDVETGRKPEEERFMSELKGYLERDGAVIDISPCGKELALLETEGKVLKENVEETAKANLDASSCEVVEIEDENESKRNTTKKVEEVAILEDAFGSRAMDIDDGKGKKRKCPDDLIQGIALLQRGVKAVVNGLDQWGQQQDESREMQRDLSAQLGCIVDAVSRLEYMVDEIYEIN